MTFGGFDCYSQLGEWQCRNYELKLPIGGCRLGKSIYLFIYLSSDTQVIMYDYYLRCVFFILKF